MRRLAAQFPTFSPRFPRPASYEYSHITKRGLATMEYNMTIHFWGNNSLHITSDLFQTLLLCVWEKSNPPKLQIQCVYPSSASDFYCTGWQNLSRNDHPSQRKFREHEMYDNADANNESRSRTLTFCLANWLSISDHISLFRWCLLLLVLGILLWLLLCLDDEWSSPPPWKPFDTLSEDRCLIFLVPKYEIL